MALTTALAGAVGGAVSASTWRGPEDQPPTATVAFNVGLGWTILAAPFTGAITSHLVGRDVAVSPMAGQNPGLSMHMALGGRPRR